MLPHFIVNTKTLSHNASGYDNYAKTWISKLPEIPTNSIISVVFILTHIVQTEIWYLLYSEIIFLVSGTHNVHNINTAETLLKEN